MPTSGPLRDAPGPVAWPGCPPARGWLAPLLSAVIVGALLTLLLLRNHRYFYVDDRIAETVPKLVDIGRLLRAGEPPWLSTSIVNGGGYAAEYLNGVYNPLNLALAAVLAGVDDVAWGSFLYVLAHCLLLAVSGAWLGRTLGLGTAWSVALGVSVGFQPYTVVWNATAWSQGLLAFSWFVPAVAAAIAFSQRPARRYGWVLLAATYGCLTSGWPLSVFLLGFFVAALLLARVAGRAPGRATVWLGTWFAGGLVCSLVAIAPLLTSFAVASRSSSVTNEDNFNVAPLEGLLQAANPAYYGFFHNFDGYALQSLPHFYAAWFLLPVVVFWRPQRFPAAVRPVLAASVATLALSALLALGPERLLVFRFPTRSLQFVAFFLLVVAGLLVAYGRFAFSRRRLGVLLGVTGVLALNALQADPAGVVRVLVFGAVLAALSAVAWAQGRRGAGRGADRTLVAGTLGILVALAVLHPSGRGEDYGFPHDVRTLPPLSGTDYTLYYGLLAPDAGSAGFREFRPSTTGLTVGDRQLNGYSSLGNRRLRRYFPLDDQGNFDVGDAPSFTQVDPATGLSFLELLRVDQIITLLGPAEQELRGLLGPQWQRVGSGDVAATYRHPAYGLPGLVSAVSPGVDVAAAPACEPVPTRECVDVTSASAEPGRVVFARPWLPGYEATLDGEPVAVEQYAGLLVTAVTPPEATGRLVLTYRPSGLLPLTALAVNALVALAWLSSRAGGVRLRAVAHPVVNRPSAAPGA